MLGRVSRLYLQPGERERIARKRRKQKGRKKQKLMMDDGTAGNLLGGLS
jgi:hypothetical protein